MLEFTLYTAERELEHDGIPIVRITYTLPKFASGRAAVRMSAFYARTASAVERHLKKRILPLATRDYLAALEQSRPFVPYRVKMTAEVLTHEDEPQTLTVRRRLYARFGNVERERVLSERWSTRLGLPEKLSSEAAEYF